MDFFQYISGQQQTLISIRIISKNLVLEAVIFTKLPCPTLQISRSLQDSRRSKTHICNLFSEKRRASKSKWQPILRTRLRIHLRKHNRHHDPQRRKRYSRNHPRPKNPLETSRINDRLLSPSENPTTIDDPKANFIASRLPIRMVKTQPWQQRTRYSNSSVYQWQMTGHYIPPARIGNVNTPFLNSLWVSEPLRSPNLLELTI